MKISALKMIGLCGLSSLLVVVAGSRLPLSAPHAAQPIYAAMAVQAVSLPPARDDDGLNGNLSAYVYLHETRGGSQGWQGAAPAHACTE